MGFWTASGGVYIFLKSMCLIWVQSWTHNLVARKGTAQIPPEIDALGQGPESLSTASSRYKGLSLRNPQCCLLFKISAKIHHPACFVNKDQICCLFYFTVNIYTVLHISICIFLFLIFLGKQGKKRMLPASMSWENMWKCKPAVGSRRSGSRNGEKAGMVYQQNMQHILNIRLPKKVVNSAQYKCFSLKNQMFLFIFFFSIAAVW